MSHTIFSTATGQITRVVSVPIGMVSRQLQGPDEDWIEGHYPDDKFYIDGFTPVAIPEQPSPAHVFNWQTKQWEDPRTLSDLKDQKWSELKAARDSFEFGSFVSGDHEFDSDQISQQRIGQAAQGAMFAISVGAPFTQDWTLKDNSVVTFDAQQMIGVALAMGHHIGYAHTHSRQLRAAVEAATTAEEVEAINW